MTVTTDGTTFTDLNELINGNTNATIALDKNYTYNPDIDSDFKNGVKISRTLTIIGNGYTIDGAGQARILDLQQGKTTLKNITFKNGSQSFFFGGGAIRCVALVEITNCTFINNHAPSGGAVQLQGWDNVISDCVFIGNTADRGAAIELSAAAYNNITGCVFYDNDIFASQATTIYSLIQLLPLTGPKITILTITGLEIMQQIMMKSQWQRITILKVGCF